MPEQDNPTPPENIEDILKQADELAAEVEADIGANLDPEALASMTPEQLQSLMGAMKTRPPQSYYTRRFVKRAERVRKRKAAKKARKVCIRNGCGRTISRRRRAKKVA